MTIYENMTIANTTIRVQRTRLMRFTARYNQLLQLLLTQDGAGNGSGITFCVNLTQVANHADETNSHTSKS